MASHQTKKIIVFCFRFLRLAFLSQFSNRSNACPDCRAYICNEKKVFLNVLNLGHDADEPISDAALTATINGLTKKISRYENEIAQFEENQFNYQTALFVLHHQNDRKKEQIKTLEKTARERNRNLAALKKELIKLEKSIKAGEEKSKKLSATIADKDQMIHRMNSTIKSMEAKNENRIEKILTENAELIAKMTRMNECIDKLDMRTSIDKMMNRRITRSQSGQKIQNKPSARQKQ